MKETKLIFPQEAKVAQAEAQKKSNYLGSIRQQNGHKCFEINTKTGEVNEANYEQIKAKYTTAKSIGIVRKIIVKEDCLYITALNKKNAIRKLMKRIDMGRTGVKPD
jgi:hypothetical protein